MEKNTILANLPTESEKVKNLNSNKGQANKKIRKTLLKFMQ